MEKIINAEMRRKRRRKSLKCETKYIKKKAKIIKERRKKKRLK